MDDEIDEHMAAHNRLHENLDMAIQEYFKGMEALHDNWEDGDYIASWALVANMGNLESPFPGYYANAYGPANMPAHSSKGLFREGVAVVNDGRNGNEHDEEDDDD